MSASTKKPNTEYYNQFAKEWNTNGGLIRAIEAGKILNLSESQISKHWEKIGLEKIKIGRAVYITWSSINKAYNERQKNE